MIPHRAIYAREKLSDAIRTLALHPGRIKDRLGAAATEVLLAPLDGLPDHENLVEDLAWIRHALTCKRERYDGEGTIAATMRTMRINKAIDIADRIILTNAKLESYLASQ